MRMTRRLFLQSTGVIAACGGAHPLGRALAMADPRTNPVTRRGTLVVVFLRGGIDGLNWVVPYADPDYARLRPTLGVARPGKDEGAIDLDGFFGLHPRAAALMPWFDAGVAAAAHAVGHDGNSRSHFEEQDVWETGVAPGPGRSGNTRHRLHPDGWLNRHLLASTGHGPVRAVALSDTLPRSLRGGASAYAVGGLAGMGPSSRVREASAGPETLDGLAALRSVAREAYRPAAGYPSSPLAARMQTAARLIKADLGLEVVQIDYGGWDTHNRQGDGARGTFGNKIGELSDALAAFAEDLGPRLDDTLVLTLSDFGRTAAQNGTRGTDHGWANAMLALGGPVRNTGQLVTGGTNTIRTPGRRRVLTDWPGLSKDRLNDGRDLRHTTDFRDVLAEVVRIHLGNDNLPTVLPGHAFQPVGLIA